MAEYKLLKTEGRAKRAEFHTVHGTIQTPVFMKDVYKRQIVNVVRSVLL